ncbi:MAG: hypothetical protein OXS29_13610 [bacterium]|nr:hypothetical protein [bacterium]MDE0289563.1 hypothetical protein [bacterium]MDE0437719.1 hypothetical protein [bacterium]
MTSTDRRRPPLWIWVTVAVGMAALAAVYLLTRPTTPDTPTTIQEAPPTTMSSRPVAADLTTTTTTQPPTTTTQAPTTTVAVVQPTTASTTEPAPPTMSTTDTTRTTVPEHAHGNLVDPGTVCHSHDGLAEHCHTVDAPSTTLPPVDTSGDCPGNYHQWYKVRDDCVLDEVRKEMLAFQAGNHAQRMASIRDGHLLRQVFADSQTAAEGYFGVDEANDLSEITSLWADADNQLRWGIEIYGAQWIQPDLIHLRLRPYRRDGSYTASSWNVVPFTYVDGVWKISYQGFCRLIDASIEFVESTGGTLSPCPPDPRPGLVKWEDVVASYGPTDDPTHPDLPLTPGW